MKSTLERFEFLFLLIPFLLWAYCFHYFFTGHLWLEADAVSYQDQINFYIDNLSKGVFPLWDPGWYAGSPFHFFLRRMGEVNPFLLMIVFLKWLGVALPTAYLIFLGVYYFLAALSFYLIARFLFKDLFFAFCAYVLLLFSSWGSEIFYNYIIIIFVPIIWFFYFLLRFSSDRKKGFFLGICFCLGLILTTYIPFFFLSILFIFTVLYAVFYWKFFIDFLKNTLGFFNKNIIFATLCILFLLFSSLPAFVFYKESKSGEFVLPNRHSGADISSAVAVGMQNVTSGDIISHGYFDRIFDDQANINMGDIYVPYLFFLVLLAAFFAPSSKLIFFLLFNILALSLITITSVAQVHRFLYEHLLIFKFIRNIYYFFWLAMLPMGILLAVEAFKSLLTTIDASSRKKIWLVYIIACHLGFGLFLFTRQGVLSGAWAAVGLSLIFFLVYFLPQKKISYAAGFGIILLAVFSQSAGVYASLDKKLFKVQKDYVAVIHSHNDNKPAKWDLYYCSRWIYVLVNSLDPAVLQSYTDHKLILYDTVVPYVDSPEFLKVFATTIAANDDIAYVPKSASNPEDWSNSLNTGVTADFNPLASRQLTVLKSDANTWVLLAHLTRSRFLVINDNFNSGWHATVNGHPAVVLRANVSFKGLWLPAGESKIIVTFASWKQYVLHISLFIFFTGVLLYLLILLKKESPWRV